ncbi:RNase H domain-containing protein [Phthorimaea operculella]|nr:RNase H domain-containing protein [Phthorimaea operculella]
MEAAAAAVRLNSLKLWRNNNTPHTAILDEAQTDLPLLAAAGDRIPKQFVFEKKYKIQLYEDDLYEGLTPKELRIFTDGSKTKSGTGSGVFSEDLNIRLSTLLGYHNSVFQAEYLAISLATTAIAAREVKGHSIRILSDSMSVLQALNSHTMTSGLIYECHQRLTEVCKHNHLTLQWIKGHSGSRGNDAADELARRGSDTDAYGPEPIIPIPAGKFRSLLRERTKNQHNTYWTGLEDCRQAREAMPTLSSRLSKKLLRLKKPQLRMITSIITGHGHFNKHLSVIGVTDSPLCRACMEEEETAAHVVLHCKEVATYRAKHLGNPRSIPEALSDLVGLLSFLGELG